ASDFLANREHYLDQVNRYYDAFQEFRAILRKFNGKFCSEAVSPEVAKRMPSQMESSKGRCVLEAVVGGSAVLCPKPPEGFRLKQRLQFYRPDTGEYVGTLEIVSEKPEYLVVQHVSGGKMANGYTTTEVSASRTVAAK